jgi:hypothetical protein
VSGICGIKRSYLDIQERIIDPNWLIWLHNFSLSLTTTPSTQDDCQRYKRRIKSVPAYQVILWFYPFSLTQKLSAPIFPWRFFPTWSYRFIFLMLHPVYTVKLHAFFFISNRPHHQIKKSQPQCFVDFLRY